MSCHNLTSKTSLIFWRTGLLLVLYSYAFLSFTMKYPLKILKRSGWPCLPSLRSMVCKLGDGSRSLRGWYLTMNTLLQFSLKPGLFRWNSLQKETSQWAPCCQVKWSILHSSTQLCSSILVMLMKIPIFWNISLAWFQGNRLMLLSFDLTGQSTFFSFQPLNAEMSE